VISGLIYETLMGSQAYGCSKEGISDYDIYGVCVPSRNILFPHTAGYVAYFDNSAPKFEQYQQSHVKCEQSGKEFDFSIYNIAKYFAHLIKGAPNCIDALFTDETCIKHITQAGHLMRDNRKLFLSKECWKTYRGYSASQVKSMNNRNAEGVRKDDMDKCGYDLKAAYHAWRLLRQSEEIVLEGDLTLMKGADEYKAIRRGDWTLKQFQSQFDARKVALEEVFHKCTLPEKPDRDKIRELLLECIETHYGRSLTTEDVVRKDIETQTLREIDAVLNKVRNLL